MRALDEPQLRRDDHRLQAGVRPQLVEHLVDMVARRDACNAQLTRDFVSRVASAEQPQHLQLTLGQRLRAWMLTAAHGWIESRRTGSLFDRRGAQEMHDPGLTASRMRGQRRQIQLPIWLTS